MSNNVLKLAYASSLTNLCEYNSSFDTGILRICYTGENKNNSNISKTAIERSLKSIYNCPIVCNYDRETDTLGGHDVELVSDKDGGLRLVNITEPVGVIPESARVWFDEYTEDDGTVNEYLYAEVLLWKRQEAYQKIKNDQVTAHSMEITVKEGYLKDGIYYIDDFEFTAFALIGVTPCFEGSALEVFSCNEIKTQFAEMMRELKDSLIKVDTSNEVSYTQENLTEGGCETLEDKMNLITRYGIDVATLDFSIEEISYEDLEQKLIDMAVGAPKQTDFSLTSNITEELIRVLSNEKVEREWGLTDRYWYVDSDFDVNEVYCWDTEDWLLYGFKYSIDGDHVVIDYESKARKKYIIADFEGGDQTSPFLPTFELLKQTLSDITASKEDISAKYQEATEQIGILNTELEPLRQFKLNVENEQARVARNEVLSRFEDLAELDVFKTLCEDSMSYSIDDLEEKCYAMRGKFGTPAKFSKNTNTHKVGILETDVVKNENTKDDEPYNGLFLRYNIGN